MARHESDREDLMREATALFRRIELNVDDEPEAVTAGFHRTGRLSVYFGGDPVIHFDESGRLRRAYLTGDLYRTAGTTLARLRRHRTSSTSELLRHDLTPGELAEATAMIERRIGNLHAALRDGRAEILQQIPEDDVRLAGDLTMFLGEVVTGPLRLAPPIPGRR